MSLEDNTTSQVNSNISPVSNKLSLKMNTSPLQPPLNAEIEDAAHLNVNDPLRADNAPARESSKYISETINLLQTAQSSALKISNSLKELAEINKTPPETNQNVDPEYEDQAALSNEYTDEPSSTLEIIEQEIKKFAGLIDEALSVAKMAQDPVEIVHNPSGILETIEEAVEQFAGLSNEEDLLETSIELLNEENKKEYENGNENGALQKISSEVEKFAGIIDNLDFSIGILKDTEESLNTQMSGNMLANSIITDINGAQAIATETVTQIQADSAFADQAHTDEVIALAATLLD